MMLQRASLYRAYVLQYNCAATIAATLTYHQGEGDRKDLVKLENMIIESTYHKLHFAENKVLT